LSNIIKSYTIKYKPGSKVTIDYKKKNEEIMARLSNQPLKALLNEGFEDGVEAEQVDMIQLEEEQIKKAEAIVKDAKKQAKDILEKAKEEAAKLKDDIFKKAVEQGYEAGLNNSKVEIEQIKNNLKELEEQQIAEYHSLLAGIEGHVSDIIASLITRLTGILVEDKMDIINYLVERALLNNDDLENYNIRVCAEDFEAISSKKNHIEEIVGQEIQITMDSKLSKNQCLIETDNKVIDCSLDVQLNNLVTDIRMLSSI